MAIEIAHVTEAWSGGISTYLRTLIEHQENSDKYSRITLIYSKNRTKDDIEGLYKTSKKVKLYSYDSTRNPFGFLKIIGCLRQELHKVNPDIIHLHSSFPGFYVRLIKKISPIIYCAHGWSFTTQELSGVVGAFKKIGYIKIEKWLAKRTDAIVNISHYEHEKALEHNVKARINRVVINGVNEKLIGKNTKSFHVDSTKINIGFIGRLDFHKGYSVLEKIIRESAYDNIHLYVIGDGEVVKKDSFGVCEKITYLGWVDNKIIDNYVTMFDVIIVPSRYEGFGIVAVEAMRNSKAVIVSNKGALPELVTDGVNGYVFDLDNAADSLLPIINGLQKKRLLQMGKAGRSTYEQKYNSARMNIELDELYCEVL